MKLRFVVPLLIFAGAALAADAPKWTQISEQTSCEALPNEFCVGVFGFTVDPRGHWTAGPSSSGQTLHGRLSPSESRRLRRVVLRFIRQSDLGQTCAAAPVVPGVSDHVTVTLADGTNVVAWRLAIPDGLCVAGNRDTATVLHTLVNQIMQRHYPKKFV